ncbi:MAG: hypothetical protein IPJ65_03270 [Archangiaceae bacterium]|nr:hypothetical protein [Archangiaceae bacterium]
MAKDFIISSLCMVPEGELEVENDLQSAREITAVGEALVADHRRAGVIDLSRFLVALHRTLFLGELTPIGRGIVLARTLEEMEGGDWITVAAELAHGLNNAQLEGIGSAGLLALKRALKSGCPERCERGLERVREILARRAPVEVSAAGGLWVVVEGWGVTDAEARGLVQKALPELRGKLGGSVVIAVSREEASTSRGVLIEHYRRCGEVLSRTGLEMLERAARFGRVQLLPQEQLLPARALTFSERTLAVLSRINAVLRPVTERIFEPA